MQNIIKIITKNKISNVSKRSTYYKLAGKTKMWKEGETLTIGERKKFVSFLGYISGIQMLLQLGQLPLSLKYMWIIMLPL